ncbi:MAG: glycosyltransferase, partial [Actinobacteria bacterium]|nr:glycosyltransferase [Actinomycetota bacterium]
RGLVLAIAVVVVAGAPALHLPLVVGPLLAVLLVPLCTVAIRRGAHLGADQFRAVGRSLAIEALCRVVLGVVAGALWGATGVALALVCAVSASAVATPLHVGTGSASHDHASLGGLVDTTLSLGLLALVAQLDVLLAPVALRSRAGAYDLAALPSKAIVVGLAAAGLAVFPKARRAAGQAAVLRPVALTAGAGVVMALCLVAGQPVLTWIFGRQRPDDIVLALLGGAMAMAAATSVGVHLAIARGGRRPWLGLLAAVAVELSVAATHPSAVVFAAAVFMAQGLALAALVAQLLAAPRVTAPPRPFNVLRQRTARRTPAVSVVVPAWNEELRLPATLDALSRAVDPDDTELIVVDDGSADATANVASVLLAPLPHAMVVRLPANQGKGAAVRAGVARARGRRIVFMDADLSTDLRDLPSLVDALDHAHVAIGSRAAPGSDVLDASVARVGMGRAFNAMVRAVTPLSINDTQCGFKAFRAPTAKLLFHLGRLDGWAFDVEVLTLAHRIGYSISEVPVHWTAMEGSHVRPMSDAVTMAADLFRTSWRWQPHRVVAAIQAVGRGRLDVRDTVDLVRGHVGVGWPVVAWEDRALGLLPFVGATGAQQVASRLQHRLPDLHIEARPLNVGAILSASGTTLRAALAVA